MIQFEESILKWVEPPTVGDSLPLFVSQPIFYKVCGLHLLARYPLNLQTHPASSPDTHGYLEGNKPYTWPKKKWGTGVTSHKWSYFTLLMKSYEWFLGPPRTKIDQKTSSQPFRPNLAHG